MTLELLIFREHLVTIGFHLLQLSCDPRELIPSLSEKVTENGHLVQCFLLSSRMSMGGSHMLFAFPQQKFVVLLEAFDPSVGFGQLFFEIRIRGGIEIDASDGRDDVLMILFWKICQL